VKVSATQPFQLIYSLFQHEYLGYLVEAYIVHLDEKGSLTYQHQSISHKNAREFSKGLDETDFDLIDLMDSIHQDTIVKKFSKKAMKPEEFFAKTYHKEKGDELVQNTIEHYLETRRARILEKMKGRQLYEMGADGEPTWRKIDVLDKRTSIRFNFVRSESNTQYYPVLTYDDKTVELPDPGAYLVCRSPAWMVLKSKLYGFDKYVDGRKLQPFLTKKNVVIPKNLEDAYYERFIAPLIASFDEVEAKGFEIVKASFDPSPVLTLSELATAKTLEAPDLFGNEPPAAVENEEEEAGKMVFDLSFKYGKHLFAGTSMNPYNVTLERKEKDYVFHRVKRKTDAEKSFSNTLQKLGLPIKGHRVAIPKGQAFSWLNENRVNLLNFGFEVSQPDSRDKKYFVGKAVIEVEVREGIDWFDIHARIRFGEFEIPFKELRKFILRKKVEFKLPNGEIAIIPDAWLTKYADLFSLSETEGDKEKPVLRKHHYHLVRELQREELARVHISERLRGLESFSGIRDYAIPAGFVGTLRPYQKAGYNWLRFLGEYRLGGCLADDMGLGKTVQTLALLQAEREAKAEGPSLLVMPTSLIYNWEVEAHKFTPKLKVLTYTGGSRNKIMSKFDEADVILTSYGITRLDIDELEKCRFNYVILDESQVIKNPTSNIAKAVKRLHSRHKLVLTGTPMENTTLDLWSQMNFINPGLLGGQTYFRTEFQNPIEKKGDEVKTKKLNSVVKPFILRRMKSQVATELPEKVENIQYSVMSPEQEKRYEEVKSYYRSKILDMIDKEGVSNSKFTLLEGLTKLRQLANHPRMIDARYTGDSGKLEDVTHMLENALAEGHKLLVFSQFVKHLDIVREYVRNNRIEYAYLDGTSLDRKEQVDRFNKDPSVRVFLISIKAGGLGLNLTEADYVFILDPWWNPAVEAQAVDRAHRIGQKRKVFTYKFITRNTVEEKILVLQRHKLKLSESLITTDENIIKNLTRQDIAEMLA
jgi:SNF2 family DNA or RNA helicase